LSRFLLDRRNAWIRIRLGRLTWEIQPSNNIASFIEAMQIEVEHPNSEGIHDRHLSSRERKFAT
jgi:hypothetical protein